MRHHLLTLVGALLVVLAGPAAAVTIDWVAIGNPGNSPDTPSSNCWAANCGSVAYSYSISKYEVTNAQYAEFLNAKAASDPFTLYFQSMDGITRSGVSGSFTYAVNSGFANKPVNYVSFFDGARFTNWLSNGQGSGDTETGAYTLLGGTPVPSNATTFTRTPGATIFMPSENEWYKAAFFNGTTYFDYPIGSNTAPTCAAPGATPNTANCGNPAATAANGLTNVGAYTGSASPYGTFDQGGNVFEWVEENVAGSRISRGGSWGSDPSVLSASVTSRLLASPDGSAGYIGFRVVTSIPEPGTGLLGLVGLLGLASQRKRYAKAL